jgi:acyl-CoA synthetase (AMP-forming)/AMP-acid ligase II
MQDVLKSLTMDQCIRFHARNIPTKLAISDRQCQWSYRQLDARINRVASALCGLGLKKGDRIAVLLRNRVEWAEILLGCARSGVVCVPINNRFMDAEVGYVLEHSEASAIITEASLAPRIDALRSQLLSIPSNRYLMAGEQVLPGYASYEDIFRNEEPKSASFPTITEDDCWYLGYTSGTTGRPKAVVINHRCRVIAACYAAIEFGVTDLDKTLLIMPLFHSNGIFFMLLLLYVGGTVHVAEGFEPEETLRTISEHGITLISLVPTMYAMILALPPDRRSQYHLDSLRVTISSSAPLLAKTKEEMMQFFPGASIYEFYGSTEASFVTCLKPRDQERKLRSVGQPFFGTEVRLIDPDGREVPVGAVGELWSRSAMQTFDGYYKDQDATRSAYDDGGWFSAGDMATRDEEGYLYIVDRKKDLIISGGENIYPTEVENVLSRHPAIAEVAIIGVPDDVWGDRVCAVVCLRAGHTLSLEELRGWAKERIADFKCPRELLLWDELPKGPTGKLLRRNIRDLLKTG